MANATGRWLALSLLALGCGGSSTEAPAANTSNEAKEAADTAGSMNAVSKTGTSLVELLVGPGGGTLALTEGPRVVIPPGAVQTGQTFVLRTAPMTTAFSNKESEKPVGPTFSFSPALDSPEGKPIEVSLPMASVPEGWGEPSISYEVQEGAAISYGEDSTRTRWKYDRASLTGGRIVAKLDDMPGMRLQFVLTNLEAE